jgi:hypothetical protein
MSRPGSGRLRNVLMSEHAVGHGKVVRGEFIGDSAKAGDTISTSPHESDSQTFKEGE